MSKDRTTPEDGRSAFDRSATAGLVGPDDSWIDWDAPGHDAEIEAWLLANGFEDTTWHNDICPSFHNDAKGLRLWINELDLSDREGDGPRFALCKWSVSAQPPVESLEYLHDLGEAEEWAVMRQLLETALGISSDA